MGAAARLKGIATGFGNVPAKVLELRLHGRRLAQFLGKAQLASMQFVAATAAPTPVWSISRSAPVVWT
jgi:hypothetical protein